MKDFEAILNKGLLDGAKDRLTLREVKEVEAGSEEHVIPEW